MKTGKRNNFFIFLISIFITFTIYSQDKINITDTIMHYAIKIQLPVNYKRDLFCYGEECFLTYYYQDSIIVSIFSGGLQRLPLLAIDNGFIPYKKDTTENCIRTFGCKDGKYWREDSYKDIRIYYRDVPMDKKCLFESILNNFIFEEITCY